MVVILKDGTMITNAKVSDIEEMMSKGIIGKGGSKDKRIDAAWKPVPPVSAELNETHGWLWENEQSDMQKMLDACNTMCKDNDKIPPQNYTGFDGTNYSAPGMEIVKSLMDDNRIVNSPSASDAVLPKVDFPSMDFSECFVSTAAMPPSANTSVQIDTVSCTSAQFDTAVNLADDYKKFLDNLKKGKR